MLLILSESFIFQDVIAEPDGSTGRQAIWWFKTFVLKLLLL
jgi:hypothetical protein